MPERSKPATPEAWRRAALEYIAGHPDRPLKVRGLAREFNLAESDYPRFRTFLRGLIQDGTLVLGPGRTLALPTQTGAVVGTLRLDRRGHARVEVVGRPDVFIRRESTGGALDGDTVAVRLLPRRGPRGLRIGEVTRVIERAPLRWVGVLEKSGRRWIVQPQGRTPAPAVQIDDPTARSARPGDLVVVEPLLHTLATDTPRGVILERLGDPSDAEVKVLGVVRRFGIPDEFPPEVRRAAQAALRRFSQADLKGREDLRDLTMLTIDPADARDFDDAISLAPLDHDRFRLGVHIADVAHYVSADDVLDREARRRGNSSYFPGYVVPMLPEVLSNGVCSLQPGEPRLAKSVFLTYDRHGEVLDARFASSVIRSGRRCSYAEVTDFLEGRSHIEPPFDRLLRDAETLARRIRQRRLAAGMIVLALPEVEILLDEERRVADARAADTSFSHTIIEMFMVETNEAVSRLLSRYGLPHLRRIHPAPEPEKEGPLRQLAAVLGHKLPATLDRHAMQRLLNVVRGRPEEAAVNLLLLQSLAQASYSPSAEEHFALASRDYCHFTSPIRRYPDLVNHRLFEIALTRRAGQRRDGAARTPSVSELAELGSHTSWTERRALKAEREVNALLLLELMQSKVGQTFDALVVGVASFGVFAQVTPYLAEGLIHISDLGEEYWEYDERAGFLLGRLTARRISVGQPVRVIVAGVDQLRQTMTLVPEQPERVGLRTTAAPAPPLRRKAGKRLARRSRR